MADSRMSSFLPTIKCSMCAKDIEISQMGDHICTGDAGEATPPPDSNGSFGNVPYPKSQTNGSSYSKSARGLPPRVDVSAANRPYYPQGQQLTPVSASPSRSMSPMTPNGGQRSPFGRDLRNAPAPIPRAPPSPELLSSNLDSPFPPFPLSKTAPTTQAVQQGGGYGLLGGDKYAEPESMYAPVSPRTANSGGFLQRMNTITPGPFDVNGRRKLGSSPEKGHWRNPTGSSLKDATMSSRRNENDDYTTRPTKSGSGHSRTSTGSSDDTRSGMAPPRVPRKDGYGGFGPPLADEDSRRGQLRPEDRSQTFPKENQHREPYRRPSEPLNGMEGSASTSPGRQRRPSNGNPNLGGRSPPRIRTTYRTGSDAPPSAGINLAAEFGIGNPYHTPTESQSSSGSGYSDDSKASSRSSPPERPKRKPSNISKMDSLLSNMQSSMLDLQLKDRSPPVSPPRQKQQYARAMAPQRILDPSLLSPESPMDPAIRGGRLSPIPSRTPSRSPSGARTPAHEKPTNRPTTSKGHSKGNCKGCDEPIRGKSVSSADGRLTGRYHKQCFVCTTCLEPFQTATFYVMKDAPYCERHYHKLNGSVCTTCDKGIEGQYLESERKQKFHPACLTCTDCKRTLKSDYFEMNGKVYCERDAFRRAQQGRLLGPGGGVGGGGTNRMERRTTRLMMM